jgi:hypothetical protein
MSFKNEVQKLVKAELKKLEDSSRIRSHGIKAFKEHQLIRFKPLRALLDELVTAFGRNYIGGKVWDGDWVDDYDVEGYYLEVGKTTYSTDEYFIKPGFSFEGDGVDEVLPVEDGFDIRKRVGGQGVSVRDQCFKFQTEEEIMSYLTEDIAKTVALSQHNRKLWWKNWIKGIFK